MLCFWLSRCKWHGLPSLLPLIVVSDEMLWAWELREFKLSRELSLLCTPPPPPSACAPLRWCSSSRSEYQLSPNPLSLMLLSFRLGDSCRVFCANTNIQTLGCQTQHSHFHIHTHAYTCECGRDRGRVCLCVCVYRRGLKSLVTYCTHTLHRL